MPADDAFAIVEQLIQHGVERRMVAQIDWRAWADGPAAALRATVLAPFGTLAESAGRADAQVTENLRSRVLDSEPDARVALVERYLVRKLASILDQAPERIGPDIPLVQMGLDSLMAVELMSALQQDLGASVALSDLLEQASLRDLGSAALGQLTEVVPA